MKFVPHFQAQNIAAMGGSAAFTPLSLTPDLWIDPSDTTTMFQSNAGTTTVTDGSSCGFAGDKSGAAFNLTSTADDTTRPTWVSTGGFPYNLFTAASSQKLRKASSLGLYAAGACSIFIAVRGNPATSAVLVEEGDGVGANYRLLQADATTATTATPFIRNDASGTLLAAGTDNIVNGFDNTDRVIGFTDSGSAFVAYLDGAQVDTDSYTRSGALTPNAFFLGARTASSQFWNGRVYGLVAVKRVITAGEIASLTTYLGAKQGRTL